MYVTSLIIDAGKICCVWETGGQSFYLCDISFVQWLCCELPFLIFSLVVIDAVTFIIDFRNLALCPQTDCANFSAIALRSLVLWAYE